MEILGICETLNFLETLGDIVSIFLVLLQTSPFKICLGELLQWNVSQERGGSERDPKNKEGVMCPTKLY